jgi:hypothetical protein
LPHQLATITSGERATTSSLETTRSIARGRCRKPAKRSAPPAASISSLTQQIQCCLRRRVRRAFRPLQRLSKRCGRGRRYSQRRINRISRFGGVANSNGVSKPRYAPGYARSLRLRHFSRATESWRSFLQVRSAQRISSYECSGNCRCKHSISQWSSWVKALDSCFVVINVRSSRFAFCGSTFGIHQLSRPRLSD